jgi:DNA-binding CsgD family transcriptional regulator
MDTPEIDWGKCFIDKLDLKEGRFILEIGCQFGQVSAYLASRYPQKQLLVIDPIAQYVEQARHHHVPNMMFEVRDPVCFETAHPFDAVVSQHYLHRIHDKGSIFQVIHRVLKPGGKAYLQLDLLWNPLELSSFPQDLFNVLPPKMTIWYFTALLFRTGLLIERMEYVRYKTVFKNEDQLRQWLTTWLIPPGHRDQSVLENQIALFLRAYTLAQPATDLPYFINPVLEVICVKGLPPSAASRWLYCYGPFRFTEREAEVLKHRLQGKTAKEIGSLLCLSAKTVEFHLAKIKGKLQCFRRSDLYRAALAYGFIELIFESGL